MYGAKQIDLQLGSILQLILGRNKEKKNIFIAKSMAEK